MQTNQKGVKGIKMCLLVNRKAVDILLAGKENTGLVPNFSSMPPAITWIWEALSAAPDYLNEVPKYPIPLANIV